MTTINAVNVDLSGATGTVHFVGSTSPTITSPTLVTPTLGAATATSIVFNPTTSGIIGTTTNDSAAAGKVGEFISSTVIFGSASSILTSTPTNLVSIPLTAGDWDVWGNATVYSAGGSMTQTIVGISSVSATQPDPSDYNQILFASANMTNMGVDAPYQRIPLAGTTTIYLVVTAVFSTSTATMAGGIYARRAR